MINSKFALSWIDMLWAMLLAVTALFILTYIQVNTSKAAQNTHTVDHIQVVMTWPDHSANDIDLWVRTPEHDAIGYRRRENTYVYLERDDLGQINDCTVLSETNIKCVYSNEEITGLRERREGLYVVNVQFYAVHPDMITHESNFGPEPVTVKLVDIDNGYKVLASQVVTLAHEGEEATAFSFNIEPDGTIDNIDTTTQVPFIFTSDNSQPVPTDGGSDPEEP